MPGKKLRLTEKHKQFLTLTTQGILTMAEAYLESGFHANTQNSANAAATQLYKKLIAHPDFLEIVDLFNPNHEMAQDYAELRRSYNPATRLGALSQLAKIKKWIDDQPSPQFGFQVIIQGREIEANGPVELQEAGKGGLAAPKKITSLLR